VTAEAWSLRKAFAPSLSALKTVWIPFVAIQIVAGILVAIYFNSPSIQLAMETLQAWKVAGGLFFSACAGGVAGGVIPEFAKAITGRLKKLDRKWASDTGFNAFAYGIVGVQVDLFYRMQTVWFGGGNDWQTLVLKTAVDQAFFSVLISIPTAVYLYEWRKKMLGKIDRIEPFREVYLHKVIPALFPCWAFWIPMLFLIYALPSNLQFCFSVLGEAAWSILFVFMATRDPSVEPEPAH